MTNTQAPREIHLPREVQHRILDNLWNQRQLLLECSVVCRAWLPICRRLLFAQIVLHSDLAQFLRKSSRDEASIAHCIRKVIFSGIVYWPDKVHISFSMLELPNLRELNIDRSKFQFQQSEQPPLSTHSTCLPSGFSFITKIELKNTSFPSFHSFTKYVEHFTNLEELKLDNLSWDQLLGESPDHGPDFKPLSIQKLGLEFCGDYRVILNWLRYGTISDASLNGTTQRRRPLARLSCLSFPDVLPLNSAQIVSFITTFRDSLDHLELSFLLNGFDQDASNAIQKAIEHISGLHVKSFILARIDLFQFPFFSPPALSSSPSNSSVSSASHSLYAWVPSLLEAALSNELTHLTIKVWLSSEIQMDVLNWSLIDSIISASRLSTLCFQVSGIGRNFSAVEAWFKGRLTLVNASSVVIEFDFCHDLHGDRL